MRLKLATFALLPALVIQGYKVKKNIIRLPEPKGEREGLIGSGKALSILIVGDSAAAGVGVNHQNDALTGSILNELNPDFEITWQLEATTGHTTDQVIQTIKTLKRRHFDVVLSSVGVNDVTKLNSANQWIKKQHTLYSLIEEKFSPQMIIATGVPPMDMFPALPNPLGWLFGQYAQAMNQKLAILVDQHPKMDWIEYDIQQYRDLKLDMAADGFHPSKDVYQLWAKQVADKVRLYFQD